MFQSEGKFQVKILDVVPAEPKFAEPPAFDICIQVQDINNPAHTDWWRGEMSQNYGRGNFSDRTQGQITMEVLHKIGFQGSDLSTVKEQLVGKETIATTKASPPTADGKIFYNIKYLGDGGGAAPEKIEVTEMQKRMAELAGVAPTASAAPAPAKTEPDTSAAQFNPFGGPSVF